MRLTIGGHTVPMKNLDTARIRDVAELQQQTGWKLAEVRQHTDENDSIRIAVLVFLSMRTAGLPANWDAVQDLSFDDVVITQDPGDAARQKEDEPSDPRQASGDSSQDADEPGAEQAPAV